MHMRRKHLVLLVFVTLFASQEAVAQLSTRDSSRTATLWALGPGWYQPAGDLADRFSGFAAAEVRYLRKRSTGLLYGVSFDAFYGNSVKQTQEIFAGLSDESGNFMGVNGEFAFLQAGLSGGQVIADIGKLWSGGYNPNSGWVVLQGFGVQQSKIGLRNERNNFPQLQAPMIYGYDRLHRGAASRTQLRYLHLSHNERINYSVGLTVNQALTRSVRGFNIDTGLLDQALKYDLSVGLSFTWILPVYDKQESFYLMD